MLSLDKEVDLTCIETDKVAKGKILRIQGHRVDVALGQCGVLISLHMKKPGLYVGSQSGLEFVMRS